MYDKTTLLGIAKGVVEKKGFIIKQYAADLT
jgi:hypothetical protein